MLLNQFLQRRRFIGIGLLSLIAALNSAAFAQEATQDRNAISIADLTSLNVQLTSRQFIGPAGLTAEKLAEEAFARSRELLAARQTLEIAKGRLLQAGLRPNPSIGVEQTTDYLTGRSGEGNTGVGVTQVFELGGKRSKRVAVAQLEYDRAVADVRALERQIAAEIRSAYAQALAAARQLDIAERLIALDQELARVTEARLKEGDVAPLDLNLVRVEVDRLHAQSVQSRADLTAQLVTLQTLAGFEPTEPLTLAPALERPPSLELTVAAATEIALRERADLQAARIAEELGDARISLAESQRTPNLAASVRYSRSRSVFDNTPIGVLNDVDHLLTAGLSIEIPLRNRNQGEIAAAVGERAQAKYRREFVEAIVKRDVALALNRYTAAAQSLAIYGGQVLPRAEENLKTIRAAYGFGEMPVMEVIAEQRRLVENQTQYNAALRDYYTSLAELERALGKPLPASAFSSRPLTASTKEQVSESASSRR
ncbi:MAG TPA: TolC family protein [Blastocatellia bacterium]|nr:TolC family protein [Blastocatellia bacterium]HMX25470.1 TolC family protein [Blastocatellia bacterium]HMY70201.1 TolC family protein [Blastocatellia bacterium]HNG34729.1 TolC family protein [Blastocatellia bacterium]